LLNPLLVSDLDGTLFNKNKQVSLHSAAIINEFVAGGGLFTIATARMAYGCLTRLTSVDLQLPLIVMNGAALYSRRHGAYEHSFPMAEEGVGHLASHILSEGAGAFIYGINDGQLRVGYAREEDLEWTQYNSEAAHRAGTPFTKIGYRDWAQFGDIVYVAVVGSERQLAAVLTAGEALPGIRALPYRNVYTDTNCLEYASIDAGKENALRHLLGQTDADGLVVFGDNHNDLDMMNIADLSVAPSNAVPEALAAATLITETNDEDGVALEIQRRFLLPLRSRATAGKANRD
jgi:Cof subfamily protein (haloacid dehalogenase superfamily)